ncbi:hypothetical protein LOK49_LG04G03536 [Camellia lanceoleosa]|uniref:Uncharacterized protein n=1 Tax=Camellia lanceoleosa TaxID=1840588 RepID=A0ACC0I460_9ERIC|nr:hypothetical protein LOK49_LG04G03536 [Camellia lanceoleosa]
MSTPKQPSNNAPVERYCGKQEKEKFLVTTNLLSELFPNKITIDMPKVLIRNVLDCDELGTLSIVDQTLTIESAEKVIKWALGYQLMECPQNNANSKRVLSAKSIQYGLDALLETQTDLNSSEKSLKDVVTENEFEKRLLADVIPPNEIGVKFDDVGALENVKDTLKELVMLPLLRPELFKSLCHCCIRSVREILEKERKKKAVINESSDVRPIDMNDFKYARQQVQEPTTKR